ncbi:hypothetical protein [Dactylosporangium sp. CA-139066]|uniref:hypothetical protein n=1 Tax=Dactylosporangium sp. CA-139066 TaxID=3239930 RepID=UPI003D8A9EBA
MALTGMDVSAVRTLANQLSAKADEIETIAGSLSSQLDGTQWLGADADSFRGDWQNTHRTQLQNVAGALRDASTRASQNATQQEQASSS